MRRAGFSPVPLETSDILPGLQTGLINAFDTTPLAALAFQWFALAPNMADLKFAPLTGATVIDKRAWEKIPAALRPKILEASRAGGVRLRGLTAFGTPPFFFLLFSLLPNFRDIHSTPVPLQRLAPVFR